MDRSVKEAAGLFGCSFGVYQSKHDKGALLIRPTSLFTVPEQVSACLDFVGGLTRFPRTNPTRRSPPNEVATAEAMAPHTTPATIKQAYGIDDVGHNATGNLQSVVSFLEQYVNFTDLEVFQRTFDLPLDPVQKLIGPNDVDKPGVEASLDIQFRILSCVCVLSA
jgi:subtilase family serine protease